MIAVNSLRNGGNDMARYIDADELINQMENSKYIDTETQFQLNVNAVINYWISEIKYFPSKNVVTNIDVAKEIFEEIYKTMNSVYASVQHSMVGMHGDNPETMRLLGKLEGVKRLGGEIAELKKKYTEGEGTNVKPYDSCKHFEKWRKK